MSFKVPCPGCGQEFSSDIALYLHYENRHSVRKWMKTFEEIVQKSKTLFPEQEQTYTDIDTNVVKPTKQKCCTRKEIAKKKKELDDYIKTKKEKAKKKKEK